MCRGKDSWAGLEPYRLSVSVNLPGIQPPVDELRQALPPPNVLPYHGNINDTQYFLDIPLISLIVSIHYKATLTMKTSPMKIEQQTHE